MSFYYLVQVEGLLFFIPRFPVSFFKKIFYMNDWDLILEIAAI
jgi:hypothetical protein